MDNKSLNKDKKLYDLIIIGAGPAGLSAALYAIRYKLKTLILTKDLGGALLFASDISNFPGQKEIKAFDLAQIFIERVKDKIEIIKEEVIDVEKNKNIFITKTKENSFRSKTVILASGISRKKLNVPGEKEFLKKGVNYCAICDAPLFKDKKVAVCGGGNSALDAALMLSKYAQKVFILVRNNLRADPILIEEVSKIRKIKIIKGVNIKEIKGENFVDKVILDKKVKGKKFLKVEGVFVEIGFEPNTDFIKSLRVKKDKNGFIKVNERMETNIPGLYAAGDISTGSAGLRQIITASSEGVIAVSSIYNRLKSNNL